MRSCQDLRVRTEVKNQIQMPGRAVAAEMPAHSESHRRWLRLAPLDSGVLLSEVEVPLGVDPTEWPKRKEDYVVVAEESFRSLDAALGAFVCVKSSWPRADGLSWPHLGGGLAPVLKHRRPGGWLRFAQSLAAGRRRAYPQAHQPSGPGESRRGVRQ